MVDREEARTRLRPLVNPLGRLSVPATMPQQFSVAASVTGRRRRFHGFISIDRYLRVAGRAAL